MYSHYHRKPIKEVLQGKNAKEYKEYSEEYLNYFYPSLAEQIIFETNISNGNCVEIGTGSGFLAIELAKRTNLKIFAVDLSDDMITIAEDNVKRFGLLNKITIRLGDAHKLPFDNDFADLVVTHGAFHHWRDPVTALKEIHRILKPRGIGYIIDLRRDAPSYLVEKFVKYNRKFAEHTLNAFHASYTIEEVRKLIKKANISNYDLSVFKLDDEVIKNNIVTLIKSPVKSPCASEIAFRVLIKKSLEGVR